MHRPFTPRRPVRLEQRQEQIIGVAPDHERLTVIVADEFPSTDEQFGHALYGAPTGLVLKSVGGYFLSLLPGAGESLVCLPELVDTRPASAGHSDCGSHAASISKSLQEELTPCRDQFAPFHRTGSHRTLTDFSGCGSLGGTLIHKQHV